MHFTNLQVTANNFELCSIKNKRKENQTIPSVSQFLKDENLLNLKNVRNLHFQANCTSEWNHVFVIKIKANILQYRPGFFKLKTSARFHSRNLSLATEEHLIRS